MIKKYIRGNATRGNEVIKELEKLGGVNNGMHLGNKPNSIYIINHKNDNQITEIVTDYLLDLIPKIFEEIKIPKKYIVVSKNTINNKTKKQDNNLKKQLLLLEKYNIKNFVLKDNTIRFGDTGYLNLEKLHKINKDFLKGMIVNSCIDLSGLKNIHKDFFKGTTINGSVGLGNLEYVDKDFLKETTIKGDLYLQKLKYAHKDFLKQTILKGDLYLQNLESIDDDFLKQNNFSGCICVYSLEIQDKMLKNIKNSKKTIKKTVI